MKYEQIEKLYNYLEVYLDSVPLGPEHDPLLNKLSQIGDLLDCMENESIESKSKELLSDLENKELDTLIDSSITEVSEFTTNIEKIVKVVSSIDKAIDIITKIV